MNQESRIFLSIFLFALLPFGAKAAINISEIAASEATGFEWVEIVNTGNAAIDLSTFKFFEDETNHKLTATRGGTILNPGAYAVIAQDANKLLTKYPALTQVFDSSWSSLKESGEYIALKNNAGEVEEGFTYLGAPSGYLARVDINRADYTSANWQELSSATIGQPNVFTTNSPPPPPSSTPDPTPPPATPPPAPAIIVTTSTSTTTPPPTPPPSSREELETTVIGVVIVPPGLFGVRVAYIQAGDIGYEIYSYKGDFPALRANDRVEVRGELTINPFLKRVKIKNSSDIVVLGQETINPAVHSALEFGTKDIGLLFEVSGVLLDIRGSKRFFIEADGNELEVVLKNSTGLSLPRTEEGVKIKLIGVLGYREGSFILYPRFPSDMTLDTIKRASTKNDIQIASAEEKTENKTIIPIPRATNQHAARNIGLTLFFVGASSLIGLVIRHRERLFKRQATRDK